MDKAGNGMATGKKKTGGFWNRRQKTLCSIGFAAAYLLLALLAGLLVSPESYGVDYGAKFLAPCFAHPFGTDEYIRLCKKIGCEPYICTNTGTGTAEEMSDWMEYCNPESEGRYAKRPGILQPGERNLPVGRQGTKLIQ